jgi:hypothetical protein
MINTKAICISFVVEWHGEMFIVLHRGNTKGITAIFNFNLQIGDLTLPVGVPIFSTRHQLLNKFTNDWNGKYQVLHVADDDMNQLQYQVLKVALKKLSPVCHIWNSKGHPVP